MTATLYFAYGSNLLEREIRRHARSAEGVGVAVLPDHRLVFTKHSSSRGGDAASIEAAEAQAVWGYLYRVTEGDRNALRRRERGYREVHVKVRQILAAGDAGEVVDAFTFQAEEPCPRRCGPPAAYVALVVDGARSRGLPEKYIRSIEAATGQTT